MTGVDIRDSGGSIVVSASSYVWSWDRDADLVTVDDARGRRIFSAPAQVAVVVRRANGDIVASPGAPADVTIDADALVVVYGGVNGSGRIGQRWQFDPAHAIWGAPVYDDDAAGSIESVLWFPRWREGEPVPGLEAGYVVHPGSTESPAVGPVLAPFRTRFDATTWLGRGSNDDESLASVQWSLPLHYFCGFSIDRLETRKSSLTERVSDAFCLGYLDVPTGDALMQYGGDCVSPLFRLYGTQWGTFDTTSGPTTLGVPLLLTVGSDYREAIRSYYQTLVSTGRVKVPTRSDRKNAVLGMSQFNTWGVQVALDWEVASFTQEALETIYHDFTASGMNSEMFVIDDKWEGEYGHLAHDEQRFPDFEGFLERVRGDGHEIGLWAAFLRCDNPTSHGLTPQDMLCGPDGTPVTRANMSGDRYYFFDISIPRVRDIVAENARRFMRRYRPVLVKFDFGYELPSLRYAAPRDRSWGGELLLVRSLRVIVDAMRDVDPDVAVMYYSLSPLLIDLVDQHSTDDLWTNPGEYALEANRRLFFSSIMGELGVPSYGSGGYDWLELKEIWFDTVAHGPLGSLASFRGDQRDSSPTPEHIARYRGLTRLSSRRTHVFRVEPLDVGERWGSQSGVTRSWIRHEGDKPMVAALRVALEDGRIAPTDYKGLLRTDAHVVVASLTDEGIGDSSHLGIVPCGTGRLHLRRTDKRTPRIVVHALDGTSTSIEGALDDDTVSIELDQHDARGIPVEWMECRF